MLRRYAFWLLSVLPLPVAAQQPADPAVLTGQVQAFYRWVLQEGETTYRLAPAVISLPGDARVQLDTSTLPAFIERFMASGLFAPEFRAAVEGYYQRSVERIDNLTAQDRAAIHSGDYGPVLETDDMDLLFCAQEYEYSPQFIEQMQIQPLELGDEEAEVEVISSYEWITRFQFREVAGQWLISGYCLYESGSAD